MLSKTSRKCAEWPIRRFGIALAVIVVQLSASMSAGGADVISRPYGITNYQQGVGSRNFGVSNFTTDVTSRSATVNNSASDINSRVYTGSNFAQDATSRAITAKNCIFGNLACGDCNSNGIFDLCDVDCNQASGTCNPGCGLEEDCNFNGIPDECEGENVICAMLDCNNNGMSDVVETTSAIQFSSSSLPAGLEPYGLAAGDLTGDGKPDLVVVNVSGNNCSIYFNNGTGSLTPAGTVNVGNSPRSVAIGDYNGDTLNDLAVVCFNSNTASILRNIGGGTFASQVSYPAGPGPQCIVTGDIDNDGWLDLVIANTGTASDTNIVSVLRNLGSGNFDDPVPHIVGIKPRAVTLLHADNDGLLDIASADSDPDTVTILRNTGNMNFVNDGSYPVQRFPFAITAADLDGDGHTDLAVLNSVAATMSLLRNNGTGEFETLGDPLPTDNAPRSVQAIDVDGDSAKDLLVANYLSSTLSLYRNTGDGEFEERMTIALPANTGCTALAVGDFDIDGRPDAAMANRTVGTCSVLYNDSTSPSPDCNHNQSPDECDIADGVSEDVNTNGVPDECETSILCVTCGGDVSKDDVVNGADIQAFVNCFLADSVSGVCACADMSFDGHVNAADVALFAAKLLGGSPCP